MLALKWERCKFTGFDFRQSYFNSLEGVYIVWGQNGQSIEVVRVGQGIIGSRLSAHQDDQNIAGYSRYGTLLATWAVVSSTQRNGVERHLAEMLEPSVGDRFPDSPPIRCNLPF